MGQIIVRTPRRGDTTIETKGFEGDSCQKFDGVLKNLGLITKTVMTDEFYQARNEENVQENLS